MAGSPAKRRQNYERLIFEKLCLALTNICYTNSKAQEMLRNAQTLSKLITYLQRGLKEEYKEEESQLYDDEQLCNAFTLLINAIDTNRSS